MVRSEKHLIVWGKFDTGLAKRLDFVSFRKADEIAANKGDHAERLACELSQVNIILHNKVIVQSLFPANTGLSEVKGQILN